MSDQPVRARARGDALTELTEPTGPDLRKREGLRRQVSAVSAVSARPREAEPTVPTGTTVLPERVLEALRRKADLVETRRVLAARRDAGLTLRHRTKLARLTKETP